MYCSKCGSLIEDDQQICGKCGAPVEKEAVGTSNATAENYSASKNARTLCFISLGLMILAVILLPITVFCAVDDNALAAFALGFMCLFSLYGSCGSVLVAGKKHNDRFTKVLTIVAIVLTVIIMIILLILLFVMGISGCVDAIGDFFHHC